MNDNDDDDDDDDNNDRDDANENAAYYSSRGEQEDAAARKAVNPRAADIHRSLASRYRAKACGLSTPDADDAQKLSVIRD